MVPAMALDTLKPAASIRPHLLLAATMWSLVGLGLCVLGVRWTLSAAPGEVAWLLTAAAVAGILKARFVLDKAAGRIDSRIRARGDGRCLGGFLSLRSWLLVLFMAAGGRLLRGGVLPLSIIGPIYTAVGIALAVASRVLWRAYLAGDGPPQI